MFFSIESIENSGFLLIEKHERHTKHDSSCTCNILRQAFEYVDREDAEVLGQLGWKQCSKVMILLAFSTGFVKSVRLKKHKFQRLKGKCSLKCFLCFPTAFKANLKHVYP